MPKNTRIQGSNSDDVFDARGIVATMQGGKGNDTYYVDDLDDVVNENNEGGIDTIISLIGWILDKNVENLTLAGTDDISGTGNEDGNILTGNSGTNELFGLAGDDTLVGGDGDDLLSGGSGADFIDGGEGIDTAAFDGTQSDYAITWEKNDLLLTDADGISDVLRGVEVLQFADGLLDVADIPVNEAPLTVTVAVSDFSQSIEDSSVTIDVLQNDLGEAISLTAVASGLKGAAIVNEDGTITYIPNENAFGEDRFSYTIVDGAGKTSTAEVVVDISPINDVPVAVTDVYSVEGAGDFALESVLQNDVDVDGDVLSVVRYDSTTFLGGTVTMNADGSFHYQPPASTTGEDTFTYTVDDGFGAEATTTVSIAILASNSSPDAVSDIYSLQGDQETFFASVLDNDADPDGDALTILSYEAETALGGTVSMAQDGTFSYSPAVGAVGTDSFSYIVGDGNGGSATSTVSIVLETPVPDNSAPTATADSFGVETDTVIEGNVIENDTDPDGDVLTVLSFQNETAAGGSVSMLEDGSFIYTPPSGYSGSDNFSYTVTDGHGHDASAEVSLNVLAPSETPIEDIPYYVEAMLANGAWQRLNYPDEIGSAVTIKYAFMEAIPEYYTSGVSYADTFQAFSEQQREFTREILSQIESYTNITFTEVESPNESTLAFGIKELGGDSRATGAYPNGDDTGSFYSDVWLDIDLAGDSFAPGSDAITILMHEIGHTAGLVHPTLPGEEDNNQYTVMELVDHVDGHLLEDGVTGYQLYDIAALQHLYGTNQAFAAGDDLYEFDMLDNKLVTIWDGGGSDTLDLSAATYGVNIDLNDGAFSTIAPEGNNNLAIAYGADIENAVGSAYDDILTGNELDNIIKGGGGNDVMTGGAGADTYGFNTDWGQDTIEDYTVGEDTLDFSGTGLTVEDLLITAVDGDTLVSYGENSLRLRGIDGEEKQLDETFLIF
ncbi:Ig-like domain-containing protein [Boseongicola aestuarii]|uniref:Serralysin n=1 Tax=Boseongicola aestuarii TaxID=1470561 RepID=A0A238IYY3_9RHOB|nr:Ig-like domain-containing protein [Boseongicola aestuarii]SMX23617.1 Serralysin [Boseongicola aestuarii]